MLSLTRITITSLLLNVLTTISCHFFYRNDIDLNDPIDISPSIKINELKINNDKFCVYDGINITLSLGYTAENNENSFLGRMSSLAIAFKSTHTLFTH